MTDLTGRVVIRFDGPPDHDSGRFVEVERDGASINYGEWVEAKDGYWLLVLPTEPSIETLKELVLANQNAAINEMGRAKSAEAKLEVAEAALKQIQKTCTTWVMAERDIVHCRETARKARDEIKLGTVDKGGVNEPPTSPQPDVVVKPQAPRRRVAEGYQPTHGGSAGSPPKGGSALGKPKPVEPATRLAIDGFEQCLRDYDAIEAELFPEGVVFASWTTVANTRRWIEDTILPALKRSGELELSISHGNDVLMFEICAVPECRTCRPQPEDHNPEKKWYCDEHLLYIGHVEPAPDFSLSDADPTLVIHDGKATDTRPVAVLKIDEVVERIANRIAASVGIMGEEVRGGSVKILEMQAKVEKISRIIREELGVGNE